MRLQSRLERIEAAPVVKFTRERRQARRVEIEKFRAFMQPDLDEVMRVAEYCGISPPPEFRAEIESDWIEIELLLVAEYRELFGDYAERTEERSREAIIKSDTKFYQEVYGREYAPEDFAAGRARADRVREDMAAGIHASESEAARQIFEAEAMRPARLKKHTDAFAAFIAGLDSRIPEIEFDDSEG
jgi:hypothetical protein